MSVDDPRLEPAQPPPVETAAREARQGRRWAVGIALAILAVLLLAGLVLLRSLFGGTTVTVTNVGDRPVEGIVLLGVSDVGEEVRDEWPVGTLQPGEAREVDHVFHADTDLAVRLRTSRGVVVEDRLPIYLGSPTRRHASVDVTTGGVVRARAGEAIYEREAIHRGLKRGR